MKGFSPSSLKCSACGVWCDGTGTVRKLPPAVFEGFQPDQLKKLPVDVMGEFSPQDLGNLPPAAMGGFDPRKFGALPPAAMKGFSPEQFDVATCGVGVTGTVWEVAPAVFEGFQPDQLKKLPVDVMVNFHRRSWKFPPEQ